MKKQLSKIKYALEYEEKSIKTVGFVRPNYSRMFFKNKNPNSRELGFSIFRI